MIKNISKFDIKNDEKLKKSFLSAKLKELDVNCNIYNGNFFADSFNCFPITESFEVFQELYQKENENSFKHFFTKKFLNNFQENSNSLKKINHVYLLGSSPGDNYFANMIYYLPRLFFNDQQEIKLAVHRNLSNKFRNFIYKICKNLQKKITFTYLDDEFYNFQQSLVPQFLSIENSVKILKFFLNKNENEKNKKIKLYVSRQNTNYRKLLNESDVIPIFKKNDFKIVNLYNFEIEEQINLFTSADIIVSPLGSNLTNIIFCKKGTKIYEIAPNFNYPYEINLSHRYENLCKINNLEYYKIIGDSVKVKNHPKIVDKYISTKVLEESTYYNDIIIRISELKKYFS